MKVLRNSDPKKLQIMAYEENEMFEDYWRDQFKTGDLYGYGVGPSVYFFKSAIKNLGLYLVTRSSFKKR
jgi:hypothetical protein